MNDMRNEFLRLLNKKPSTPQLLFSGLISVTEAGLKREGLQFHEVHNDAAKMARAAASTHRISGFGSAVVPLDMYVEAEALGAKIDFMEKSDRAEYPRVLEFLFDNVDDLTAEYAKSAEKNNVNISAEPALSAVSTGRVPIVCEAIKLLKEDVGEEIVIGGYVPGPFTLLSLLVETMELYSALRKSPESIHAGLGYLVQFLAGVGNAYFEAGADFLTVHEMGGSPGALGPKVFESIVLPHLQSLISTTPKPIVLSACGRTNGAMHLLAASGADALSVDQTNDLEKSRQEVPDALLFGNLDPLGLISQGTPKQITEAVDRVVRSGADAVWPGCDLFLDVPIENLKALVQAFKK